MPCADGRTVTRYQVIVAGGGPAGLTAAGRAAELGAAVLLLEKMTKPGIKLSITGKGRCNLTNIAPLETFLDRFGKNGTFLRQAFSRFFTGDLFDLLGRFGIQTVEERGGRIFPAADRASIVADGLVDWNRHGGVVFHYNARVEKIILESGKAVGVACRGTTAKNGVDKSENETVFHADAVVLATGGASYPGTGSTGDGYRLAESVGHTVVPIRPALIPLITVGDCARTLQGLSLKNVGISVYSDGRRVAERFGEMLFTHFGISGPIVLSVSKTVVDFFRNGRPVEISIDLKPALDELRLDARLLRDIRAHGSMKIKNLFKELLPIRLVPVGLRVAQIPPEKFAHQMTAEERKRFVRWLKDFRLKIAGHRPLEEAIVTAGGVRLKEINPRTMESLLVKRLFFAGEILDVDADTGGYNLQAAFSTGWLAGESACREVPSENAPTAHFC